MDDLLREFLYESAENLATLDGEILRLEQSPGDLRILNSAFRTIHTLKGTCGFLALERLEQVAHAAETLLDALRCGVRSATPEVISEILVAVDAIRFILAHLESEQSEPAGDDRSLVGRLLLLADASAPDHGTATEHDAGHVPGSVAPEATLAPAVPSVEARQLSVPAAEQPDQTDPTPGSHGSLEGTLRVPVGVLDSLMNLAGELALNRNHLLSLSLATGDATYTSAVQHLDRITADLLDAVMRTRMQPVGNAWTKLPRLLRDLAISSGKQLSLDMSGAATELDRQILQAIQDPLTHMVRNSADHGIELPAVRLAAGKPAAGTIRLSACHEGGHIVIDIADDGAGINVERVRQKAIERGILRAEEAAGMPEAQLLRVIFEPGFSTATEVTSVSGRGVGMDVVRNNIELIGGTVELTSRQGEGTTIRVRIPLTLAIIPALLVNAGGESFALPQTAVVEVLQVMPSQPARIERVHETPVLRLREHLIPLVALDAMLRLTPQAIDGAGPIVICHAAGVRFGVVVDTVIDTQEIVVKPSGRLVKHLQAFAGCTIAGDGRVMMILDAAGLVAMADLASPIAQDARSGDRDDAPVTGAQSVTERVLLFDTGRPALQAVHLTDVARLELIPASSLEEVDGQVVVQYRGELMPLVTVHHEPITRSSDPQPAVVISHGGRLIGLAVNAIRDIADAEMRPRLSEQRAGVLGLCLVDGRATELLDVAHYCQPYRLETPAPVAA